MNDYKKYKLEQLIEKLINGFFDYVFYLPRELYKKNEKFKNYILSKESKGRRKQIFKKCLSAIFRDLDRDGICVVFTSIDYDNEFCFDRDGYDYKILLDDDAWITKNKLNVERYTLRDYIEKVDKERLYMVGEWRKEETVLIITKEVF